MSGVKFLEGTNRYDTSSSGTGNVVRELKKVRNEISALTKEVNQETKDLKPQSPYFKDRREFDATRMQGSDRENDWQDVKSRKQEVDEALKDLNKIKLNIVY